MQNSKDAIVLIDISSKDDDQIQWNILHEFGHVLGLHHEHQQPKYLEVMREYVNFESKLYKFLKKGSEINKNSFKLHYLEIGDAVFTSDYDPESIMHYP